MSKRIAYISLWFPEPTETFIFREVCDLWDAGVSVDVFTLYGERKTRLSPEMLEISPKVQRLGLRRLGRILPFFPDVRYWSGRQKTASLWKQFFLRRHWGGLEKGGENLWAFFCGFTLARTFVAAGIEHIHAPWACGPATAAWVASRLTGIPFSFTARARDIWPQDGLLPQKAPDAAFIRVNARANKDYLAGFCPKQPDKVHLIYNPVTLRSAETAAVTMQPPLRLLAVGRFVGKKGFEYLLQACKLLHERGMDFRLTLVGSGPLGPSLKRLARRLLPASKVEFPGFLTYERMPEVFRKADIFIMPSVVHGSGDRDGIPNVIMEALLHRVPVVASDVSGISELIVDHETGLPVPQRDPQALADAVAELAADRDEALRLAESGRRAVQIMFDPESTLTAIKELLTADYTRSCNPRNP